MADTGAASDSALITTVPFQLVTNGIQVSVEIDGKQGYGIYDTDVRYLVVNENYLAPRDSTPTPATADHGPAHILRLGKMTRIDNRVNFIDIPEYASSPPVLALLGLDALQPYETILDFRKHQLTLVRLDTNGHHRTPVPGLTPVDSVPLSWDRGDTDVPDRYVMIHAHVGNAPLAFYFNTIVSWNAMNGDTREQFRTHLTPRTVGGDTSWTLDHVALGKLQADTIEVVDQTHNFFGLQALQQFGVVGVNLRTMQLTIYR